MVDPVPAAFSTLLLGFLVLVTRRKAVTQVVGYLMLENGVFLFGQMLACFGIVYYGVTEDVRWYAAGLALLLATFVAFPIRRDD